MKLPAISIPAICAALLSPAPAQTPAPAIPKPGSNAVQNGDFAKYTTKENLWDGVDPKGLLTGNAADTYAVTESGRVGNLPMPVSVSFTDMNGDKLPDIVSCDPTGVVRIFFNSGTKTEPKFTNGEVVPIFPPNVAKDMKWDHQGWWTWPHSIPKLALFDTDKRGTQDLVFGNYTGDLFILQNTGSAGVPAYPQPSKYASVRKNIGSKPWGNLLAPCVFDWNKDGRPDLLVGEGSYSANAVFVLLNQSSGSEPRFTDEHRHYLCYGDGREQLVPTVADWNGDGLPDVIVGDRKGAVSVHLGYANWKPGQELPVTQFVSFGSKTALGIGIAPHACDYNGDGLTDLLIGKADGHIAVAINKGSLAEPKFDMPVDIAGTDALAEQIKLPQLWTIDSGISRGNLYAYTSVQDTTGPDGGRVLKSSFFPSPNKIVKMVPLVIDGADNTDFFRYWWDQWHPMQAGWAGGIRVTNAYTIRQNLLPLKVGGSYTLSFAVKGSGIRGGEATVAYLGANENVATKFTAVGRGKKAVKDEAHEEIYEVEKFNDSGPWKKVRKTFTVHFKDKTIKKQDVTTLAILEFKFELEQYTAFCEIADVKLTLAE